MVPNVDLTGEMLNDMSDKQLSTMLVEQESKQRIKGLIHGNAGLAGQPSQLHADSSDFDLMQRTVS